MEIKKTFNMNELLNHIDNTAYYETENMKVSRWKGFDDWRITDLTNALTSGKVCIEYTLKAEHGQHGNLLTTNFIEDRFGNDLKALWAFCEAIELVGFDSFVKDGITIYRSEHKGVRIFSPFNLNKIKPLKTIPKKWTLRHVYSALVNGQFTELKCNGVYTDDYAYDNAVNYRRGEIAKPLEFVKDILENPSGWHAWNNGTDISISCHTFDCNSFVPVI